MHANLATLKFPKSHSRNTIILYSIFVITILGALVSCEDAMVESETYGSIHGEVFDDSSGIGLAGASVTTSPASEALVTNDDGKFDIEDIPTGNYTITINKSGYNRSTVNVAVRELRTTNAVIPMHKESDEADGANATADIIEWRNVSSNDSVHVHVDYRIQNTGSADIEEYDILFRIESAEGEFFHNEVGTELQEGRIRSGSFEKYIRREPATDVEIYDIWFN